MSDTTREWDLYEKGKDYNRKIDLGATVDRNERMYAGDQWKGVVSNGLPTPVFNIFKRIINYFIAAIMSSAVKMQFTPENIGDDTQDPQELEVKQAAEIISKYSETLWENLKMDNNLRQVLLDAALSGDACAYCWWNPEIDTGQEAQGDNEIELPDNVNVFFGNPNDYRVQKQPYNIISFRELVSSLRDEARKNGVEEYKVNMISGDTDTQEQSGDMAKIELDTSGENTGKTTAIIKFWRDPKTKTIWWNKSTRAVTIRENVDTGQKLYPIAWMNWDKRKNSYHGQAVGTGLVPNQIFINKMFAMVMLNLMYNAFPKAVYDSSLIKEWNNQIGQAIPVTGGQDVNKVAAFLQPGNMSNQVMQVIDASINYTKDMLGASDAALGDVKPDNHAAIIAVQQAAAVPLETIKANLYQFVEDIGYIWLDMMATKYGKRNISISTNGQRQVVPFDFNRLKDMRLKLKVDVGPSSYWSEITAMQTLDNLLQAEKINFLQYLERIPNGVIPQKQELIDEIKQIEQQKANTPPVPTDLPNVSISMRDLPVSGQIQAAAMAGIQLNPEDFQTMLTTPEQQMPGQAPGRVDPQQLLSQLSPEQRQELVQLPPDQQAQIMQQMQQAMGGNA